MSQVLRVHQIRPIFYQTAFHPKSTAFMMPYSALSTPDRRAAALRHLIAWMLILGGLMLSPGLGPRPASAQEASAETRPVDRQAVEKQPVETQPAEDAAAQSAPQQEEVFLGIEHRREIYEQSRLTVAGAVGRNLLLPGLGNIYADQYFYAGLAFSFMVFAASFASYGLVTDQAEYLWIGAGTAGIAYVGSIGTSILGVEKYNRERREGLKVELERPASPFGPIWSPSVNLGWRF